MLRGNWRYIAAIVGLLVLGGLGYGGNQLYQAAEQQQRDYDYQPAGHPGVTVVMPSKTPAQSYQPTCQNPQSQGDADLCAQWAAVEQVAESNRIASFNLRLGIGALIFTILGTWLLVWTFWETRSTARRELRAYVSAVPTTLTTVGKAGEIEITYEIRNDGQTPAYAVCNGALVAMLTADGAKELGRSLNTQDRVGEAAPYTLHKGQVCLGLGETRLPVDKDGVFEIPDGHSIYVFGFVEYHDTFGKRRESQFGQYIEGAEFLRNVKKNRERGIPAEVKWRLTPVHNVAT